MQKYHFASCTSKINLLADGKGAEPERGKRFFAVKHLFPGVRFADALFKKIMGKQLARHNNEGSLGRSKIKKSMEPITMGKKHGIC